MDLYINSLYRMTPGWLPILVKVIAIYVLLGTLIVASLVQSLLYLFNDEMCDYFGAQCIVDTFLWILLLLIFTFEFKYVQKITK
jgi:hypothetical protein